MIVFVELHCHHHQEHTQRMKKEDIEVLRMVGCHVGPPQRNRLSGGGRA